MPSTSRDAFSSAPLRTIIRHLERSDSELTFEEAVVQAFLSFDTDSSGFLDNQQMKSLGVDMDDEAIQEMMNEAPKELAATSFLNDK